MNRQGACSWLSAATETGLLTQLEQALPPSPLPPSPGSESSSAPAPLAHPAVSGSSRAFADVGPARLYRRWSVAAHRTHARLWLSLHRSLFITARSCRWSGALHGCPRLLDHPPLAFDRGHRRSRTSLRAYWLY